MEQVQLQVVGMSCEHCSRAVESALCDLPGVVRARADYQSGRVKVEVASRVSDAMIGAAVEEAGYELAAIER